MGGRGRRGRVEKRKSGEEGVRKRRGEGEEG